MHNVLGIIAEYNPLHNGHVFHIKESKKIANADFTICIMSGNFVQRGVPSLIDKWTKSEMAISNGIDLVIELPVIYSTSSAENFADGAIKILHSLNIVDAISFGAETDHIDALNKIATILCHEPLEYKTLLNYELSKGISFPKAREIALIKYFKDTLEYSEILSQPNNVLAIEYLKALQKFDSYIKPIVIKREKVNYNSLEIVDKFASSTAIRALINDNHFDIISNVVPETSFHLLRENFYNGTYVQDLFKFEKEIIYELRKLSVAEIATYPDVSEGLEYSLKKAANSCNNLDNLIQLIKSKRYTQTRIQRILTHILLNIQSQDISLSKSIFPYVRVLGFNNKGKTLISELNKKNPHLSVITSVKKFMDMSNDIHLKHMLAKDIFATNIYTLGFKCNSFANLDFTHKLIQL